MPTGYTYPIEDGTLTEFPQFAMNCARAFGALIEMRDDPLDKPIPDAFEPSNYHTEAVKDAEAKLKKLLAMTASEIALACEAEYVENVADYEKSKTEQALHRSRYAAMREKVEAWTPPTSEHENLKKFMLEQIDDSVSTYEPSPPELETPEEWLASQIERARDNITYHTTHAETDRRNAAERTAWVKALRKSLQGSAQ